VAATRLKAALRRADHAIGRAVGRVRVLVDVRTPMNLAVLQPMWERLAEDRRVHISVTAEAGTGVDAVLRECRLAAAAVPPSRALWRRFDLAMTADLWNHTPLRRCARRVNFFHGVAGKYDLDDPAQLREAGLARIDRVAFVNADRMQRYLAAGVVRPEQAVLVGFPKSDALVNGTWRTQDVRGALGLAPELPTLLYAPTFSTANSLHRAGEPLIDALLGTGHNVIVKLHDRSMVPHERYTAGIDWPARLARFVGHPRFALARTSDVGPLLTAADVLITDHSSVGFEFALLDRPVIVFDCPHLIAAARIDAGKWELLRAMAEVVENVAALPAAVARALSFPLERSDTRRQIARDLFAYPGQATARALQVVYCLLELDPAPGRTDPASATPGKDGYEVFDRHRDVQPRRRPA
jgi:CDP-glycerol glycerophosphotransferase (TagB/SpsB family)